MNDCRERIALITGSTGQATIAEVGGQALAVPFDPSHRLRGVLDRDSRGWEFSAGEETRRPGINRSRGADRAAVHVEASEAGRDLHERRSWRANEGRNTLGVVQSRIPRWAGESGIDSLEGGFKCSPNLVVCRSTCFCGSF